MTMSATGMPNFEVQASAADIIQTGLAAMIVLGLCMAGLGMRRKWKAGKRGWDLLK